MELTAIADGIADQQGILVVDKTGVILHSTGDFAQDEAWKQVLSRYLVSIHRDCGSILDKKPLNPSYSSVTNQHDLLDLHTRSSSSRLSDSLERIVISFKAFKITLIEYSSSLLIAIKQPTVLPQ